MSVYRPRSCVTALVAAVVAAWVMLLVPPFGYVAPAVAQQANPYFVSGMKVDVSGELATDARQKAISEGAQKAWAVLAERLAELQKDVKVPKLAPKTIDGLIQDFSVNNEKVLENRYIAVLDYTFNAAKVRRLVRGGGQVATVPAKPLAIVPIYDANGQLALWDDPNPWRQVWRNQGVRGLVPFVHPQGDARDLQTVTAQQALAGERTALGSLGERYNTSDVMVVLATLTTVPETGGQRVNVVGNRFDASPKMRSFTKSYDAQPGESTDDLLRRASASTAQDIDAAWKRGGGVATSTLSIPITVPVSGLEDWVSLNRQIQSVEGMKSASIAVLSVDDVIVRIVFNGSAEQLKTAMANEGLALTNDDGKWVVRRLDVN